ncbi:hypothetical protein BCR32DRAFT_288839 [Anaeromyces robustus]|uniref:HNH domain-containing protein n=1 Tax=Anaeromyces robustus TaxID=1754192 RepID=A0A1Y1XRG3_9FUNG|nr:hypothetical protein BCR32DRAFT_288839 [Anaeromyces robustus]|eukprot:ORX88086.1 hypothetical protein BCR32DRAFT_288839 [Anaeromyces robustus]
MKRKSDEDIIKKINAKKKPIYENCSVYTIDNLLLFRCNRKKINWYLSKDLADIIEAKPGEDFAIRLKFVARGKSHSDTLWGTEDRANQCCVCGSEDHLNLHHVFPYVYRKWCPEIVKSHTHHDILPLCTLCHANYEIHAQKLKTAIVNMFNMPLESRGYVEYPDNRPVIKAANALKWHSEKIPEERKKHLFKIVHDFFETRKMADTMSYEEMINQAMILPTLEKSKDFLEHGEYVIKQILSIPKGDSCSCTNQNCPCKNKELQVKFNNDHHNIEKKSFITEKNQLNKEKQKQKKELKEKSKDKDKEKQNQDQKEKEKKDEKDKKEEKIELKEEKIKEEKEKEKEKELNEKTPIELHFSASKIETDDPNGSSIERDLEILNNYINKCCGNECYCQCQRLPMPEQMTKEFYKPEGYELKSLTTENQSNIKNHQKDHHTFNSDKLPDTESNVIGKTIYDTDNKNISPASPSDQKQNLDSKTDEMINDKNNQRNKMLERFIKMWRKHFLIYTQPKYLSISWQVSNSVYCD